MPSSLAGIARFPRARLGHAPTTIEAAPNLSAALGVDLRIKRDDCTGLALGGNKVRQLEDRVADGGETYRASGNLLLDRVLGATLHPFPEGEAAADAAMEWRAAALAAEGRRRPYVIHSAPGHPPLGGLGYVLAAEKIVEQAPSTGFDAVVCASGTTWVVSPDVVSELWLPLVAVDKQPAAATAKSFRIGAHCADAQGTVDVVARLVHPAGGRAGARAVGNAARSGPDRPAGPAPACAVLAAVDPTNSIVPSCSISDSNSSADTTRSPIRARPPPGRR